ncbi:MAG: sugar ABC transporter ATP-binding protein [Eubacteriales bacterium]|nr:sugar ABC transporter ATP-binding protein [Eubacteriales bacterium]
MSENENKIILKAEHVKKSFGGVHALKDASLELRRGEVHGLVGENGAGKSTLMKILLGIHKRDAGTIVYKGEPLSFKSPKEALSAGIVMVHQEINMIMEMSIAENLFFGREEMFMNGPKINIKKRVQKAQEVFKELKINIDATKKAKDLSIAELQLVEIARAASYGAEIIIMDEPTSALADAEVKELYRIIDDLISQDKAVVFISHKLDEILRVCHRVTVLRDGEFIETRESKDVTKDMLISSICGRENVSLYTRESYNPGEVVLSVKDFTSNNVFEKVNFEVRAGEVLGFAGLMGAGRTEIARALFGIDKHDSGEVFISGKKVHIRSPKDAVRNSLGMVTEDRLRSGCIYTMSIIQNATLAVFPNICNKLGIFKVKNENSIFKKIVNMSNIKFGQDSDKIGSLSGGNQQKVIIGRWLSTEPKILILDEPTRGIDVGAKSEIYKLIDELAQKGIAVIMISSEMPELFALCDRIVVVRNGMISGVLNTKETNSEEIMHYCFGTNAS